MSNHIKEVFRQTTLGGFLLKNATELAQILKSLDGQKYGVYKRLKGIYQFKQFQLVIDHIQVDPYAPPSKMRVVMNRDIAIYWILKIKSSQ